MRDGATSYVLWDVVRHGCNSLDKCGVRGHILPGEDEVGCGLYGAACLGGLYTVYCLLYAVCCVLCTVYGFTAVGRSLLRGSCGYFYVYRGLEGG